MRISKINLSLTAFKFYGVIKFVVTNLHCNVHCKNLTPFWEYATCFGCETKTWVVCKLVIFQDRLMFSHHSKGLDENFPMMRLNAGLC